MNTFQKGALIALGILAGLPFLPQAAVQAAPASARIEVLRTPVFLSPDCVNPQVGRRLLSRSRRPLALRAGELVQCGPGGAARIFLTSGVFTMTSGQELPILDLRPAGRAPVYKALHALLETAGNSRGRAPIFLSPSSIAPDIKRSMVWPATFAFEWRPFPRGTTLTLTLRETPNGPALWQESGIKGEAGRLISPGARQVLIQRQKQIDSISNGSISNESSSNGSSSLVLEVQPKDSPSLTIPFLVISAQREHSLREALNVWSRVPDVLLRHLGRASVFCDYTLFADSAAEYSAASELAPNTVLIRRRSAEAQKLWITLLPASVPASLQKVQH